MKGISNQCAEYLDYCENILQLKNDSMITKKWVCHDFIKTTKIKNLKHISNKHIDLWIKSQIQRGNKASSINVRVDALLTFVNYFENKGLNMPQLKRRNIKRIHESPPRAVYYSKNEIDQVLKTANDIEWLLISLSYDCGFRISELTNLEITNIDGQKILFIGKGSKNREVYMSAETKQRLDQWVQNNHVTKYLWETRNNGGGKPITTVHARETMRKAFNRAGFYNFYPHALRHSFATNICDNGAPLPVAQKMLGHSHISTTERYIHSFDNKMEQYFKEYKFTVTR